MIFQTKLAYAWQENNYTKWLKFFFPLSNQKLQLQTNDSHILSTLIHPYPTLCYIEDM